MVNNVVQFRLKKEGHLSGLDAFLRMMCAMGNIFTHIYESSELDGVAVEKGLIRSCMSAVHSSTGSHTMLYLTVWFLRIGVHLVVCLLCTIPRIAIRGQERRLSRRRALCLLPRGHPSVRRTQLTAKMWIGHFVLRSGVCSLPIVEV